VTAAGIKGAGVIATEVRIASGLVIKLQFTWQGTATNMPHSSISLWRGQAGRGACKVKTHNAGQVRSSSWQHSELGSHTIMLLWEVMTNNHPCSCARCWTSLVTS
jgi:hypothetical protein